MDHPQSAPAERIKEYYRHLSLVPDAPPVSHPEIGRTVREGDREKPIVAMSAPVWTETLHQRGRVMGIEDLLAELHENIKRCTKCRLAATRTKALCGEGNPHSKLMLIAQAPGKNEDREGRMFIGPAGKVLDELLKTVQMDRKDIYMTNLFKCMLPQNRRPKSDEIEICARYLDQEIELISPRILAPLGNYATRYLFDKFAIPMPSRAGFRDVYGKILVADDKQIMPLQHPAAVLYNNSLKEVLVKNYRKMRVLFAGLSEEGV